MKKNVENMERKLVFFLLGKVNVGTIRLPGDQGFFKWFYVCRINVYCYYSSICKEAEFLLNIPGRTLTIRRLTQVFMLFATSWSELITDV